MDLLRHKFLTIPLLFCMLFFALDKIFLTPAVLEHTLLWKKIEPPFYQSREWLFEQLQEEYPRRTRQGEKLGLILGTSRSAEFNTDHIAQIRKNTYTYNFSAPLACPSFHYYWLDRILAADIRPSFVILETGPILFSPNAVDFSLSYAYDFPFVLTHTDLYRTVPRNVWNITGRGFSFDEAEVFFLKNLFATYKYPPDLAAIRENNKEIVLPAAQGFDVTTGREFKRHMLDNIRQANRRFLGGIPNPLSFTVPPEQMEADAENLVRLHLQNPDPSPTQALFFKKTLARLALAGIPGIVYWPVTSDAFRNKLTEKGLLQNMQKHIRRELDTLRTNHPNTHLKLADPHLDKQMDCRVFDDAHHLNGICFDQLAQTLLHHLPKNL